MCALADDAALIQHQDLVRVQHGRNALRHDDDGSVVGLGFQCATQRHVGFVVQRREAIVKQVNPRVLGNRAGDGQPLFLPAGDIAAALGNRSVVALGLG